MSNDKKILGAQKKAEREKAANLLAELKDKTISTMSKAEIDKLITALCLRLGIADVTGKIK
jgi:hypothetical protein